jgi:hypothetical protein
MNYLAPRPCIQPIDRQRHAPRSAAPCAALFLAMTAALAGAAPAQAQWLPAGDQIRIAYAPTAIHFIDEPEYVNGNHILALEWLTPRHTFWGADRTHFGVSVFDNSYGQPSQSVYAGLEWDWKQALGGDLFLSLSAGLIHGYKEPYEDKIPLNNALGVGVTLVPSIGWQRGKLGLAATLTGSAVAFRISYTFGR